MNHQKRKFISLMASGMAAALSFLSPASAQKTESWTGYLVDRSCAAMIKTECKNQGNKAGKDPSAQLAEHTRSCSLDPSCSESGYTLYSHNQWLDLDPASSALARKVVETSKKSKGLQVKVDGIVKRGEIKASSIVELK